MQLTTDQAWHELEKELFAVLGMVTSVCKARTVGIVYIAHDRKLYLSSKKEAWKVRHIRSNPLVSLTLPIAKRIPFLPWIKIPAATISFCGEARVLEPVDVRKDVLHALVRGLEEELGALDDLSIVEIKPCGDFITYGIGIPIMEMRYPEKARGRAPTNE